MFIGRPLPLSVIAVKVGEKLLNKTFFRSGISNTVLR